MRKVRVYYKGRYYYLGKAKNLEEELNLKRDFLRQVVNIPEEDIELFRRNFTITNKTVKFIRNVWTSKRLQSACKVLGIKPIDKRRKLEEHVLVYIQLSTITQAINFIANGNKPWVPKYEQNELITTWYSWWYIDRNKIKKGSDAGCFNIASSAGFSFIGVDISTHLQFINRDAAIYAAKTFKPLYMKHMFGMD